MRLLLALLFLITVACAKENDTVIIHKTIVVTGNEPPNDVECDNTPVPASLPDGCVVISENKNKTIIHCEN